eukprot:TRINITY_DN3741_c1_g1_i1.p1 TRINITY_DN3741_c1_g1~~TRINITY_DN3741_c1_g1_i1.p1  ORF type:complete len:611 (+),score=93.90 TRINITY_DN3741_c1_g1_i1:93-1835(+)
MDVAVPIAGFLRDHVSLQERVQARIYGEQLSVNVVDCDDASLAVVLLELVSVVKERCSSIALQLFDCSIGIQSTTAITGIGPLITLISIHCRLSGGVSAKDVAKAVASCSNLEILMFENIPLNDDEVAAIVQSASQLSSLTTIGFENANLSYVGIASVLSLLSAPKVTCTQCGSYLGTITCLNVLWYCKSCKSMHTRPATQENAEPVQCCGKLLGESGPYLRHCCCDESGKCSSISQPGMSSITSLSLSGNVFTATAAFILSEALNANFGISCLSLRKTDILSFPFSSPVDASRTDSLKSLDLSENHLGVVETDRLQKVLADRADTLRSLSLSKMSSQTVFSCVQSIANCENLVSLDLSGNMYPVDVFFEVGVPYLLASLRFLKNLNISNCSLPKEVLRDMAAVIHQSATPGLYSTIDISLNDDTGEAATLWSSIPQGTIDVLLRTTDLSGTWTVSAGNCPPKKDVSYTFVDVIHNREVNTVNGTLPGANNTWECAGIVRDNEVTIEIDWRGGRTSRFALQIIPPPLRPSSPYLYHEACQRVHMVGTLFNDYDGSRGDVAVIVSKPQQKWSQAATALFGP